MGGVNICNHVLIICLPPITTKQTIINVKNKQSIMVCSVIKVNLRCESLCIFSIVPPNRFILLIGIQLSENFCSQYIHSGNHIFQPLVYFIEKPLGLNTASGNHIFQPQGCKYVKNIFWTNLIRFIPFYFFPTGPKLPVCLEQ